MRDDKIRNLIFDLGGVILDLSVDHTLQSIADLSGIDKARVGKIFETTPEFLLYEKGELTDNEFRDCARRIYGITADDQQMDNAWNAMLRGMPLDKLQLLDKLKKTYNVFLLSNTNNIHLEYINNVMMPPVAGGRPLDDFFHRAYYSHRMKMRKPDAEIFEQVLQDNNLNPAETLFLDDNASNVAGAAGVGIKTVFVNSPNLMLDYFNG